MPVKLQTRDLDLLAGLPAVQVVDHLLTLVEPHEVDAIFVPHRDDVRDEVALVLAAAAPHIARLVHKPRDPRPGTLLLLNFLNPHPCRANKISPPPVMRCRFVFLPLLKGRPAAQEHIFALHRGHGRRQAR